MSAVESVVRTGSKNTTNGGNTPMADKKVDAVKSDTCINGRTLVTFGCEDNPSSELLALLEEVQGWDRQAVGQMVLHQIGKYLGNHRR